jgi:hypothetical protein
VDSLEQVTITDSLALFQEQVGALSLKWECKFSIRQTIRGAKLGFSKAKTNVPDKAMLELYEGSVEGLQISFSDTIHERHELVQLVLFKH